jgi:hypothetical protein
LGSRFRPALQVGEFPAGFRSLPVAVQQTGIRSQDAKHETETEAVLPGFRFNGIRLFVLIDHISGRKNLLF